MSDVDLDAIRQRDTEEWAHAEKRPEITRSQAICDRHYLLTRLDEAERERDEAKRLLRETLNVQDDGYPGPEDLDDQIRTLLGGSP